MVAHTQPLSCARLEALIKFPKQHATLNRLNTASQRKGCWVPQGPLCSRLCGSDWFPPSDSIFPRNLWKMDNSPLPCAHPLCWRRGGQLQAHSIEISQAWPRCLPAPWAPGARTLLPRHPFPEECSRGWVRMEYTGH